MEVYTTLAELLPGEYGRIGNGIGLDRRLTDLGFVPGGTVRCLFESAAGDPKAYLIRGTVIALRQKDASCISVVKAVTG